MLPEKERGWWLDRVRIVGGQEYNQIVAATPRMSEAAREFCLRLLEVNRRRLFDDFV
jgi:hypothetical protein